MRVGQNACTLHSVEANKFISANKYRIKPETYDSSTANSGQRGVPVLVVGEGRGRCSVEKTCAVRSSQLLGSRALNAPAHLPRGRVAVHVLQTVARRSPFVSHRFQNLDEDVNIVANKSIKKRRPRASRPSWIVAEAKAAPPCLGTNCI